MDPSWDIYLRVPHQNRSPCNGLHLSPASLFRLELHGKAECLSAWLHEGTSEVLWHMGQWIGLRDNFNRKPGKPAYVMVTTMVSCRFSLNPMTGMGDLPSKRTKSLLWKPWPTCSDSDLMVMSSSVRLPKTAMEKTWIYPDLPMKNAWWIFPHCKRWPEATPVRIPSLPYETSPRTIRDTGGLTWRSQL